MTSKSTKTPLWKKYKTEKTILKALFIVCMYQSAINYIRVFFSGLPKHIKVAKFKFVVNQSCNLFYEPSDDALP